MVAALAWQNPKTRQKMANYHNPERSRRASLPWPPPIYLLAPKKGIASDEERSFLIKCAFDPKQVGSRYEAVPYLVPIQEK
jgi:hypothetical protein